MSARNRKLLTLAALLAAFVVFGVLERQDTDADQKQYCQMVRDGYWPDFHHSYKAECTKP